MRCSCLARWTPTLRVHVAQRFEHGREKLLGALVTPFATAPTLCPCTGSQMKSLSIGVDVPTLGAPYVHYD